MEDSDGAEEDLGVSFLAISDSLTEMEISEAARYSPAGMVSVKEEMQDEEFEVLGDSKKDFTQWEEDEARWTVAKVYFKDRSLVQHQLRTFNEFLETGLPNMFREAAPIEVLPDHSPASIRIADLPRQARITYGDVFVGKPETFSDNEKKDTCDMYPREARLRNLTYAAPINVEMTLEVDHSYLILPLAHKSMHDRLEYDLS